MDAQPQDRGSNLGRVAGVEQCVFLSWWLLRAGGAGEPGEAAEGHGAAGKVHLSRTRQRKWGHRPLASTGGDANLRTFAMLGGGSDPPSKKFTPLVGGGLDPPST